MSSVQLSNLGTVIAIVLFIIVITAIGFNLKKFISDTTKGIFTATGNTLLKIHNKNLQKAAITSKKTFAKSKTYKDISQIIFDLGLNDVTVEGFICSLVLASLIVGIVILLVTRSIILFIFLSGSTLVLLYTVAYMMASEGHFKREFAIMDAIDLIIVNMKDGVLKAVKEQIDLFDPLIQPDMQMFIDDMYEYKIPVAEALDSLGERLGPSFTKFKEKAKEFEEKGRAGMLETFADDMNENMYRRMDLRELLDTLREANTGFALAMCVCGFLGFAIIGSNEALRNALFTTTIGQVVIVINIILIIAAFAYIQSLREEKRG